MQDSRGAHLYALGTDSDTADADLAVVAAEWPGLSAEVRGKIVALVRRALVTPPAGPPASSP